MDEIFCISNKTLYSEQSGSRVIEICEDLDNRWMNFGDGFLQSAMSLKHPEALVLPYMQAMMAPLLFLPAPKKLLLLGLGGGALVRFFRYHLSETQIIALENDSSVVRLASRYFDLPEESTAFHIHVADAEEYIQAKKAAVDWLMVDLFSEGKTPEAVQTDEFLINCKQQLTDDGILVINSIPNDATAFAKSLQRLRQLFDKNVLCCQIKGYRNIIHFAFNKKPDSQTYAELANKAAKLQEEYGIHFKTWLESIFQDNPTDKKETPFDELELSDLFMR